MLAGGRFAAVPGLVGYTRYPEPCRTGKSRDCRSARQRAAAVADPEGRSHLIVRPDGSLRLIDFGVSLLLREHPAALTFEDAWNAARTDPMFRLFRQMSGGGDNAALGQFVAEYGRRLAGQTAAEIQARDWRIADEGATVLAKQYGPDAAAALRAGFTAASARQSTAPQ